MRPTRAFRIQSGWSCNSTPRKILVRRCSFRNATRMAIPGRTYARLVGPRETLPRTSGYRYMTTVESPGHLARQGAIVESGGLGPDLACRSYPHEPPHRGPSLLKFIHAA